MNNDAISKLLDRDITYDGPTAVLRFESHDQAINFICEARRLVGLQPSYVPLKHTNAAPQGPENREARDGSSTALPTVSTPEVAAPTPRTDAIVALYPGAGANFDGLLAFARELEYELSGGPQVASDSGRAAAESATDVAQRDAEDAAQWRIWSQQIVNLPDHNFPAHSTLERLRDAMRRTNRGTEA